MSRLHYSYIDFHINELLNSSTQTLQYAVAGQLMHDQRSVDESGLLDLIGNDAAHEMGMSRVQICHQLQKRLLNEENGRKDISGSLYYMCLRVIASTECNN